MSHVIVVVEGPSAAGKTTWSTDHGTGNVVPETSGVEPPDGLSDEAFGQFWTDVNCRRWAQAVAAEGKCGVAVCDTDPLKLHYDYCLARVGAVTWRRFDVAVNLALEAISARRLGMADIFLVSIPDHETLERQRNSDSTRNRRNFELHRRLGTSLRDWYATLDRLDPGRVCWEYPQQIPAPVVRQRHDANFFRCWMAELPRPEAMPTGS